MKSFWVGVIGLVMGATIAAGIILPVHRTGTGQLGAGQIDTIVGSTNTYTQQTASTTLAQKLLSSKTGRIGLRISNTGATNPVRVYLQSTSTGVTATSGINIAAGGVYVPDFNWEGEVWDISTGGATVVEAQETTP